MKTIREIVIEYLKGNLNVEVFIAELEKNFISPENHTPQTKPDRVESDNSQFNRPIGEATVRRDKTAEASILQTIKGCKAVIRDGSFINQQCAQNKLDGMEEMLGAVEKMDEEWEQKIIEHCDFVLEEFVSQEYAQGFADMEKVILKGFEDRKIKLAKIKEELNG